MGRRTPLPTELPTAFSTALARGHGTSRSRLNGSDLAAPFHGVRIRTEPPTESESASDDPYERQRHGRIARARQYAPRLHTGHLFSHETAAAIWGAPLPLFFDSFGRIAEAKDLELHVCAVGPAPIPRTAGVSRHKTYASLTVPDEHDGLRVPSPAATWVQLGHLALKDIVAAGDYFCRRWRPGYGRPNVGTPPLAEIDELRTLLEAGRRRGAARLRTALDLIREDSWSPRESAVRIILVAAGLPEPRLNIDLFDDEGRFLGCVDMAYPERKVAIEYLGMLHGASWAQDVERIARLRAAGWNVLEVTSPLLKHPDELVRRVAAALAAFK